eukprot:4158351-Alexandrium_andersonii.AAC.1
MHHDRAQHSLARPPRWPTVAGTARSLLRSLPSKHSPGKSIGSANVHRRAAAHSRSSRERS